MKFPEHLRLRRCEGMKEMETKHGDPFGWFVIAPCSLAPKGLKMMACDGTETGWEHVSVSHVMDFSCPTWEEMTLVAGLFWDDDETLVQYRPPKSDYVNQHPGVLHWWRKVGEPFPMPPKDCV